MKTIKITPKEELNINHRKEKHFMEEYTLITSDLRTPIILRIYGTNAMNYACVWILDNKKNIYCNGSGSAGGYGYHRPSAAVSEALTKAGIELSCRISGRGDTAIENAIKSIGTKLGYKKTLIHKAHA